MEIFWLEEYESRDYRHTMQEIGATAACYRDLQAVETHRADQVHPYVNLRGHAGTQSTSAAIAVAHMSAGTPKSLV